LMGQGTEAKPVVILRGLKVTRETGGDCRISGLLISGEEDLFKGVL